MLRRLLRLRQRTDSRRKAVGNHLRALLRRHFIAVPAGKDVAVWLQNHPGTLERLSADDRVLLGSLLRQYRVLQEEVEALTAEVAARVQDHPIVQCLLTTVLAHHPRGQPNHGGHDRCLPGGSAPVPRAEAGEARCRPRPIGVPVGPAQPPGTDEQARLHGPAGGFDRGRPDHRALGRRASGEPTDGSGKRRVTP